MTAPTDVSQIDWATWEPTERAVLCFVQDGDRVMLIHKKTGLGKGKINAPGGRIDPGETPVEAAARETLEETHVTVSDVHEVGQLFFEFVDGYKLHGTVFFANEHSGTPASTPEADPFWCDIDTIPYDDMWEDDQYWLPRVLAGQYTKGYFIFRDDTMLSYRLD